MRSQGSGQYGPSHVQIEPQREDCHETFWICRVGACRSAVRGSGRFGATGLARVSVGYPSYDSATHTFVSQCANAKVNAASKPAGLAAPAWAENQDLGWPWGYGYNPIMNGPAPATSAASKPAGLAKFAPVDAVVPYGLGESPDPLGRYSRRR
jgi:hypothetical protein